MYNTIAHTHTHKSGTLQAAHQKLVGEKTLKNRREGPIYLDSGTVPLLPMPPGTSLITKKKEQDFFFFFFLFFYFFLFFFSS